MRYFILILFALTSCVNETADRPVDNIPIHEVGQELKGHWRLVWTEARNGNRTMNTDLDNLEYYEFDGLKGINSDEIDNHDGTFGIATCPPVCRLKRQGQRTMIEYAGMFDEWESDILELSNNKLVLADRDTGAKWTYERIEIKKW